MHISVTRRVALRYGLTGAGAALLAACGGNNGGGGGLGRRARAQALVAYVQGSWDVTVNRINRNGRSATDSGVLTVRADGTWDSTIDHLYREHGGTWQIAGSDVHLTADTRSDGRNTSTRKFGLFGVPTEVENKTSVTAPVWSGPSNTDIDTITVDGDTFTLASQYQVSSRMQGHQLRVTDTRQ